VPDVRHLVRGDVLDAQAGGLNDAPVEAQYASGIATSPTLSAVASIFWAGKLAARIIGTCGPEEQAKQARAMARGGGLNEAATHRFNRCPARVRLPIAMTTYTDSLIMAP
jgi:hypothetical protein